MVDCCIVGGWCCGGVGLCVVYVVGWYFVYLVLDVECD